MERMELTTDSAASTERIARVFAEGFRPGDVVLVSGDLGTGKTTFIRGACRTLGVTDRVSSPTFTVGRTYAGRVAVAHLDLYRLSDLGSEDPALLDDYLTPERVAFVEWPEVAEGVLPQERVTARVALHHLGGDARRLVLRARPELLQALGSGRAQSGDPA